MKDKEKQFKERVECGIAYCEDTPNKQIEEMAKVEIGAILEKVNMGDGYADINSLADQIYHIVLPEDSVVLSMTEHSKLVSQVRQEFEHEYKDKVVLSREEYEKLKNESIDKLFADETFYKEEFKANEEHLRKRADRYYIKLVKKQERKETAEKCWKLFKQQYLKGYDWVKSEFEKQFGVEIKEN